MNDELPLSTSAPVLASSMLTSTPVHDMAPAASAAAVVKPSVASPSGSTESSASTVRAGSEVEEDSPHTSASQSPQLPHLQPGWSSAVTEGFADWRTRSVSAPASRSSSFANLDQLVTLNQSAHRFPAALTTAVASTSQQGALLPDSRAGTRFAQHLCEQRTRSSSSASTTITTSQSTPSSPRLSPALSSASFDAVRSGTNSRSNVAARARAALFPPGSGFTPAFAQHVSSTALVEPDTRNRQNSTGSTRQPSSSTSSSVSGDSRRSRRYRSTSASEGVAESDLRSRAGMPASDPIAPSHRPRRPRAHSARTSPTLSTHTPLEPAISPQLLYLYQQQQQQQQQQRDDEEAPDQLRPPQRTHSVPHLARLSPIFYSYGYPCEVPPGFVPTTPSEFGGPSGFNGYFALPPSAAGMSSTAVNRSSPPVPASSDELPPPPYSPNDGAAQSHSIYSAFTTHRPVDLAALGGSARRATATSAAQAAARQSGPHSDSDAEDDDHDDDALSFSTSSLRARSSSNPSAVAEADRLATVATAARQAGQSPVTRSDDDGDNTDAADPSAHSRDRLTSPVARNRLLEGEPLDEAEVDYIERLERPSKLRQFVLTYLVHPLRLLAVVPGMIGTFWLLRNAVVVAWTSRAAWRTETAGVVQPSSLEFVLAALWSITTAYHALSFTTLLLRRWLHYYALLPSLIRIMALQALCWPLVRMTLYVLGPRNPLPAWIIISSTTALSDTVARFVVSEITDESDAGTPTIGQLQSAQTLPNKRRGGGGRPLRYSAAVNSAAAARRGRPNGATRRSGSGGIGMAFWRAIMGAPPRKRSGQVSATLAVAERRGFATESEAESEAEGVAPFSTSSSASLADSLRRRTTATSAAGNASDFTSGGEGDDGDDGRLAKARRIERVGRIFHADVAIRRNVLPIGVLAFMTMWVMLVEDLRHR